MSESIRTFVTSTHTSYLEWHIGKCFGFFFWSDLMHCTEFCKDFWEDNKAFVFPVQYVNALTKHCKSLLQKFCMKTSQLATLAFGEDPYRL